MKYSNLESNIIDVMKEEQLKLGYRSEVVRLYYPLASLNRLMEEELDVIEMEQALGGFAAFTQERLGQIEISYAGERFCLAIPSQGSDYVHEHMDDREFICDFIQTVGRHGCTMEEVLQQFYNYSSCIHVEQLQDGEFDYLVYFEDGKPDSFRYCFKDEGGHIIYHRFTIGDYEDFGF